MTGASVDDALAALSIDLPSWYLYDAQQRHPANHPRADGRHEVPWIARVQHRDGALLTTGTGESLARALWSAIEGARAIERGRAIASVPSAPRFSPTQDAETACL